MINVMMLFRAAMLLGVGSVLVHCAAEESECPLASALCVVDGAGAQDAGAGDAGVGDSGVGDATASTDANASEGAVGQDQGVAGRDQGVADTGSADADGDYLHEHLSVTQVATWIDEAAVMTLLDVREPHEYAAGHLAGAVHLPLGGGVLEQNLDQLPRDRPVVLYCASGNRSHRAATLLTDRGFRPVYDMEGGYGAWLRAGLPVEDP